MLLAALVQAGTVVLGLVLAYDAINCAFMAHHGHSFLCTFGVFVNWFSFGLAAKTLERARDALGTLRGP